ncbi:protein CURVATURE THYLAKOID 1A, chloroplastic-like isoform X1 [Mangifera indica]|uniref:protein CURVATURE THYLAKOID 1A, chloroplastic-like isoform X1 n=1 Tax=Mangifera indica TaxID=29780 RepID=UPI001CF9F017|nr:protein CURVATURE THYLAKOID 1A, chloroplastic-like isoform X1 [Mangifera indica]
MAATAYAAATAVLTPRVHASSSVKSPCFSALPYLPPRLSISSFSSSITQVSGNSLENLLSLYYRYVFASQIGSRRFSSLQTRASSEESPVDAGELFTDLKEKWDAVENKSTVILYGGGAIVAVWLSSIVVSAINSIPLLPKIMELVGLGYTGWFVYRYLLFKSSRKELATDIEALKKKIAGTE